MNREQITLGAKLTFRHYAAWSDDHTYYDCVVAGFASNNAPIVEVQDGNSISVFLVQDLEDLSPRTTEVVWWAQVWVDEKHQPHLCGFFRNVEEFADIKLIPPARWCGSPYSITIKVPFDD